MSNKARINTSEAIGLRLRKSKVDYEKKFKPAKISIEALSEVALELGIGLMRKKLNIE